MGDNSDQVVRWLNELPFKLRRELAAKLKEIGDDVAADIRAAAPQGPTGHLKASIRSRRVRNSLLVVVEAGGTLTTKAVGSRKYARQINIGSGEETQGVAKGTKDVAYDYALAVEFGTSRMTAEPFFYATYRARAADIEQQLNEAVAEVVSKM